jgi:hypothetical protein
MFEVSLDGVNENFCHIAMTKIRFRRLLQIVERLSVFRLFHALIEHFVLFVNALAAQLAISPTRSVILSTADSLFFRRF